MVENRLPDHRGWYPDPYQKGYIRWFDGTEWTIRAVPDTDREPDKAVEGDFDGRSPEQMRADEWRDQFPWWDTAVARGGEPAFDFRGGPGGFELNQAGRFDTRLGQRLRNLPWKTAGWILLLAIGIALLAWGDSVHRVALAVLAGMALMASGLLRIRSHRNREHWDKVGQRP